MRRFGACGEVVSDGGVGASALVAGDRLRGDELCAAGSLVVVPRGSTFGDADQGLDVYHFEEDLISEVWLTIWKVGEADQ